MFQSYSQGASALALAIAFQFPQCPARKGPGGTRTGVGGTRARHMLNPRERRIFEARRLANEPMTLEALSGEFGISRERVRQIEIRAFEKIPAGTLSPRFRDSFCYSDVNGGGERCGAGLKRPFQYFCWRSWRRFSHRAALRCRPMLSPRRRSVRSRSVARQPPTEAAARPAHHADHQCCLFRRSRLHGSGFRRACARRAGRRVGLRSDVRSTGASKQARASPRATFHILTEVSFPFG
jgi:hypothetical protein